MLEGTAFFLPLRTTGYGRGVLARWVDDLGFGYFFGPARSAVGTLDDFHELNADDALVVWKFSDAALVDGVWPVAGVLPGFDRAAWPLPDFGQYVDPPGVALRFSYVDDDLSGELVRTRVSRDDLDALVPVGVAGPGAVEIKLTAAIDPAFAAEWRARHR